ncbi:hypothetical protein ACTFIY_012478 [Dictyostelium cf. discoideum]
MDRDNNNKGKIESKLVNLLDFFISKNRYLFIEGNSTRYQNRDYLSEITIKFKSNNGKVVETCKAGSTHTITIKIDKNNHFGSYYTEKDKIKLDDIKKSDIIFRISENFLNLISSLESLDQQNQLLYQMLSRAIILMVEGKNEKLYYFKNSISGVIDYMELSINCIEKLNKNNLPYQIIAISGLRNFICTFLHIKGTSSNYLFVWASKDNTIIMDLLFNCLDYLDSKTTIKYQYYHNDNVDDSTIFFNSLNSYISSINCVYDGGLLLSDEASRIFSNSLHSVFSYINTFILKRVIYSDFTNTMKSSSSSTTTTTTTPTSN